MAYQPTLYVEVDGKRMLLADACKLCDIRIARVLDRRYKKRVSIQEAFDYCADGIQRRSDVKYFVEFNNRVYPLWQACRMMHMEYNTVLKRMKRHNIGPQEAFERNNPQLEKAKTVYRLNKMVGEGLMDRLYRSVGF